MDLGARHGDRRHAYDEPVASRLDHRRRRVRGVGSAWRCALELGLPRLCDRRARRGRTPRRAAHAARRAVRRARAVPCARAALAVGGRGHPHRRTGLARGSPRRVLRRAAPRDADPLHRRCERAREPEAPVEVDAGVLARDRCRDHGRAHRRSAARRERTSGAARPRAARRRAGFASTRAAPSRRARDDRRARPFDPAGRGDGRPGARSHDRDERATEGS